MRKIVNCERIEFKFYGILEVKIQGEGLLTVLLRVTVVLLL